VKLQSKLTETQINELKRAFAVLDKDGSGSISREELAILITKLDPAHGLVVGEHVRTRIFFLQLNSMYYCCL